MRKILAVILVVMAVVAPANARAKEASVVEYMSLSEIMKMIETEACPTMRRIAGPEEWGMSVVRCVRYIRSLSNVLAQNTEERNKEDALRVIRLFAYNRAKREAEILKSLSSDEDMLWIGAKGFTHVYLSSEEKEVIRRATVGLDVFNHSCCQRQGPWWTPVLLK